MPPAGVVGALRVAGAGVVLGGFSEARRGDRFAGRGGEGKTPVHS